MDPFRYHDTNEFSSRWTSCPQRTTADQMMQVTSPAVTVPSNHTYHRQASKPRAVLGPNLHLSTAPSAQSAPPQYVWEKMNNTSRELSLTPSPTNSYRSSLASSPPSSLVESGLWRHNYSRANSVSTERSSSSLDGFRICSLCKKNGEEARVYSSHQLHVFRNGKRVVDCAVLRRVRCQICGATGDDAHTLTHCPYSPNRVPVALVLKSTARQCDGSLRKKFI